MAVDDKYTMSLIHFDGNFNDESERTWAPSGGAALSTVQSKFGGSSYYRAIDGRRLQTNPIGIIDVETGDITVDFQIYPLSITNLNDIFSRVYNLYNFFLIRFTASGQIYFTINPTTYGYSDSSYNVTSTDVIKTNQWNHVACIRNEGYMSVYINGNKNGSLLNTTSLTNANTTPAEIGNYYSTGATQYDNYYLDEFRISKIARWTSSFTPPVVAYGQQVNNSQTIGGVM